MQKGFSLIEIIIILVILLSMTGLVSANYIQYGEERKLNEATITLTEILANARARALSGDLGPYACGDFGGYRVGVYPSSSSAAVKICCNSTCTQTYDVSTYQLKSNLTANIAEDYVTTFQPYAEGVSVSTTTPVVIKNSFINKCNWVRVTSIGVIEVGEAYAC